MEASPKRRKVARGDDDFSPGNITQLVLHNFMTYSHLTLQAQPRLNVVIGPNGTGKSSIVCGICLGLAGEPQLLGRAASIGDFVMRGEESGWTSVSLRGTSPGETVVIRRNINRSNKSEWLINDKAATKKQVQDLVLTFNIQVSNLTQFLPQDRVCEFAKMSPIQLLEETEKAVGNPELSQQHLELIQKNEELKKLQVTVRQNETLLEQCKANNADLEKDVEKLQQKNKLLEKAEHMKMKLPWLRYDQKKQLFHEAKRTEMESKDRLEEIAGRIVQLKAPIQDKKRRKEQLEIANTRLQQQFKDNCQKRTALTDLEATEGERVKSLAKEIENLHRQEALRAEKAERARRDLANAEEEAENFQAFEPPREQILELNSRIRELEAKGREKILQRQEKDSLRQHSLVQLEHCLNRIKEIESVKTRKLEALRNNGVHQIMDAYKWVHEHRESCRKEVYGPILLEVDISDKQHATFLEGHVPFYIWQSFITQDAEDRDFLVSHLKQYGICVLNFREGSDRLHQPPAYDLNDLRDLGITTTLDRVFSAPPVVKNVLVSQAGLNNSFIGGAEANERADRACELGIRDLWTPDNHYRWQESRYGGHISAIVRPVRPGRLFSHNVDARELGELQQRKADAERKISVLDNEIATLKSEHRHLEDETSTLHKQREGIQNRIKLEKRKMMELTNRIEQRRKRLDIILNEEDPRQGEARLQTEISKVNERRCQNALELKDLFCEGVQNRIVYAAQQLSVTELHAQIMELERNFRGQEQIAISARREFDQCHSHTTTCREELSSAKQIAERTVKLMPELQEMFQTMPTTVEALEEAIVEVLEEANSVLCRDPNILVEYKRRCDQIANLTAKLDAENDRLDQCSKRIELVKDQWLPTLRALVSRINDTFGKNFQELAIAGEVSLDEHQDDFDKYGILIKVKFREAGELQVLSAHHQSGGERSVSTMLYLVSLQDLSHCPFRVVDEINQGMDPNNERKMFQQLVRASSQANTPQCFLLTPKLLPDFKYSPACHVMTVMNGPWIPEASRTWRKGASYSTTIQEL